MSLYVNLSGRRFKKGHLINSGLMVFWVGLPPLHRVPKYSENAKYSLLTLRNNTDEKLPAINFKSTEEKFVLLKKLVKISFEG